jgi:hypothetical protein
MWDRSTPWRQGHVLTPDAIEAFKLAGYHSPQEVAAVVVSHDCDLAQSALTEATVEVVVGTFLDGALDGNFTNSKNPRRLHLPFGAGSEHVHIVLDTSNRALLQKESGDVGPGLEKFLPSPRFVIDAKHKGVLQNWLAARYRRAAFPDEFDRRFGKETKMAERMAAAIRPSNNYVVAVFFDLIDSDRQREGPFDTYELRVALMYASEPDPAIAEKAARSAAAAMEAAFQSRCMVENGGARVWQWIELVGAVQIISDRALSYADAMSWTKWHADHISFREDPPAPILA